MSLSSKYFLRQSELRAAEEELQLQRTGRINTSWQRRAEINSAWQQAAEDLERERQYQASIANTKGEKEYSLPDGL